LSQLSPGEKIAPRIQVLDEEAKKMATPALTMALPDLIAGAQEISAEVKASFGSLSPTQINWKPSAESWSVGQCIDHLIVANRPYGEIIDQVVQGRYQQTFLHRLPVLPGMFGRLLIKSLDPKAKRKLKAPAVFKPAASTVDGKIIDSFLAEQQKLIEKMKSTRGLNLAKIMITSPALSIVTYSLLDALRIIVVHEQRHFGQAKRVTATSGFPNA
jgi:hypothetical protein